MARHSSRVDGRPSFQFYPNDWRSDTNLRLCSLAAQGLWMDMLCLMFMAPIRGTLTTSKKTSKNKQNPENPGNLHTVFSTRFSK